MKNGSINHNGQRFTWEIDTHGTITVLAVSGPPFGSNTTQLGGWNPEDLARVLAAELGG